MEHTDYIKLFEKFRSGTATTDDIDRLLQWLHRRNSFDAYADEEWLQSDDRMDSRLQKELYRRIRQEIHIDNNRNKPKRTKWFRPWIGIAAAAVILLAIAGTRLWKASSNQIVTIPYILAVTHEKQGQVLLPDSSRVWLNAHSTLRYPANFAKDKREVALTGEAYFNVKQDKTKPFVVSTRHIDIRVTGTQFDVKASPADSVSEVILVSGSVNVRPARSPIETRLLPSQKYQLTADGTASIQHVNTDHYTAWTKEYYEYQEEMLGEVIQMLERHYHRTIACSPDVARLRASGIVNLQSDLSVALEDIERILPVHCRHRADGSYYISPR